MHNPPSQQVSTATQHKTNISLTLPNQSARRHTTPPAIDMMTSTMVSSACPMCGTIKKSGKRSCCARGGAWFNNCGDASDTKFDHTWIEGVRVCQNFDNSAQDVSSLEESFGDAEIVDCGVDATNSRNRSQDQEISHTPKSIYNPGVAGCAYGALALTKMVISGCVLFMIL